MAIHGLPEGTAEIPRSKWRAGVHPEDLARLDVLRSQTYRERRGEYYCEYRVVGSGGEFRWIESRSFISYDRDGRPLRVVGVDIDVTDHKQTEARLKESKTNLADAMAAGQVMAFAWDVITRLSKRATMPPIFLDFNRAMPSPNDFLDHVHPDDRSSLRKHIRTLWSGQSFLCPQFPLCLAGRPPGMAGGDGKGRVRPHRQAVAHQRADARRHRAERIGGAQGCADC